MKKYKIFLWIGILIGSSGLYAQQGKIWTLEACINYALEQNIQIRKSTLTNKTLELYAGQAKAQRFPNASASADQAFRWSNGSLTNLGAYQGSISSSYSVSSGVTLYNGSRLTNQIKQAELDIQNGQYSLETTKESISISILNAFLQVLFAEEQVKNSEKQIESTTGQLNLAAERMNLGVISQADYSQVKSQLASEKLTIANAMNQLAIAKVNLMQLMELPVTNDFEVAKPILAESINQNRRPEVQLVYDTALSIKPQIKSAAIDKKLALLDQKIAEAGYLPSLTASARVSTGADFGGNGEYSYVDQLDRGFSPSAGLSLSIPIYQKRQAKTSVEVAKIGYQNAELSELDTRNQLRKNIEQACQDVLSAQIEYEASLEKFMATKESAALSDEKYTQGIINSVDYLVSKTNLNEAESQLLQSKYNLIFSYKILDFYRGIPLSL
jgi:outer membrane protein